MRAPGFGGLPKADQLNLLSKTSTQTAIARHLVDGARQALRIAAMPERPSSGKRCRGTARESSLGTCGRGALASIVLGSTALHIVHRLEISVTMVK
jgi:nucleotide-binding universal stress UspA family protein